VKKGGVRLSSKALRGRRLEVPRGVRPTEGRLREALLSIWRERFPGARFLDLFAGSGAVGLEAAALGAARVAFVEADARVLAALQQSVCDLAGETDAALEVVRGRLPEVLARRPAGEFDLLFADPPYAFAAYEALLGAARHLAAPGAVAAVEHSVRREIAEDVSGWRFENRKRYGESCLSFFVATA
jgi:16S rRNA (guanine966-N2)-methyltransferase